MSRLSLLSNPLLLGFDEIERLIDRANKGSGDGYPPYNVERIAAVNGSGELLRITLAVAGFTRDQIDVTLEDRQLMIRGKQQAAHDRDRRQEIAAVIVELGKLPACAQAGPVSGREGDHCPAPSDAVTRTRIAEGVAS